ncbi:MAG: hypothetical protein K5829_05975 [Treponema sp.]|nr:hypothetical protein [Treponema sp.]
MSKNSFLILGGESLPLAAAEGLPMLSTGSSAGSPSASATPSNGGNQQVALPP